MTSLVRVVTFSLLISACAVAQTKEYFCFDVPVRTVVNNPFPRRVLLGPLSLSQEGFNLVSQREINLAHIFRQPESTVHYRAMTDPRGVDLLLPLRLESSRLCQMADRGPNGSIQFH